MLPAPASSSLHLSSHFENFASSINKAVKWKYLIGYTIAPIFRDSDDSGVQFNRHTKFKAWVKAQVKDKVKNAFRRPWIRQRLRLGLMLGLRLSKMSIELHP